LDARTQRRESREQVPCRERITLREQRHHQFRMGQQLVVERAADVRPEPLVEELLELKRATPLGGILRIQRRPWPALLERGDDSRRIADRPAIDREHGHRRGLSGQLLASRACRPASSERRM
jgi:hypothetical protein